jgi:hypothetical protein
VLACPQPSGSCRSRNWRGLLSVLIAAIYLLAGALHGLHDIDVTTPAGGSEIASILDDGSASHGGHKALAGHHCHGCFSVTSAQPAPSAVSFVLASTSHPQPEPRLTGITPDTDSPPPKHLT